MKHAIFPALATLFLSAALVAQDDVIRKVDGSTLRKVEIVSETIDTVTFKNRNKDETLPANDVASVGYGGVGESLERAKYAADQGEFARAANLYQEVADSASRPPLKAWAAFWAARQLFLGSAGDKGLAATAASALQAWLTAHADHRLVPIARETLGQAQLAAGNVDEALAAFAELGNVARSKSLGALWTARGKFGEAQALVAAGKFADARTAFVAASATLSAESADNREAANLAVAAKTGEGECYLAEGRVKDAQDFFRRLASSAGNNSMLVAAARCGEAHAIFEQAKGKKDVSSMRRAQSLLAQVSATDISDGDASPKATFLLGQVTLELGAEHEGKDYLQRAKGMFQQVVDDYGSTRWAARARSALKG